LIVGLTHEQVVALQATVKDSGTGVQGHSRSPVENAVALLTVNTLTQQLHLSHDAAVKLTASSHLTSPSTLRRASTIFIETGTLSIPSTEHRGRGNTDHPLHDKGGPSFETEILMHNITHSQKTKGVSITSTTITAELREKLGIKVDRSTVRRWLHTLGYRWRHKRYVGGMKPQAKNARIRQFILEYASALLEEEAGTAVIVYMDESFIHSHLARKHGWFHSTCQDVIGDDDGTRLILMHAMTENGLLAVPETIASNWLNEPALTAELVFEEVYEDGQDDSNYHNTMTGVKFIAWVRNRLFPTFRELYPSKKMILVLDNANYHKPRDESWISASKAMNKHELAHQLLDMGVQQLITSRGIVVPAHRFEADLSAGGPSKEDLIAAVKKWLEEHPDHNETVVEQLMKDAGYSLIYTPPYCPEVQPIELLWAKVKRYVADRSILNRSITKTREQTEEGFEEITKMFCNSIVRHCHDWIDTFIKSEAAEDLQQCGCLAKVMKNLSLLKIASTDPSPARHAPIPMDIDLPVTVTPVSSPSPARNLRTRH
jgi:transposase